MPRQLSKKDAQAWPELEASWAGREIEMPKETSKTGRVRQMNRIEKFMAPGADAVAWPWGTIALDKDAIEANNSNLDDVLVHELTHVGQSSKRNILQKLMNAYRNRGKYFTHPDEIAAFEAEEKRPVRRYDIDLTPRK